MVIDTNVLVHVANVDDPFHEVCRDYVDRRRVESEPTFLTWNVCYEFFRVSTHPSIFSNPFSAAEALDFVGNLIESPSFSVITPTDRHPIALARTLEEFPELRGNVMHDVHTAILMREHGISRICTRDADFYRFPFLTVIDPLRQ